jgi:hypothetical protein
MKYYQDTITGQIYAFENHVNVEKLMQTSRNIPKTLIDKVKEKPSNNHIWYDGEWINKENKNMNYKEPIYEVPIYNPAWITFLFKEGTILFNSENKFEITLNQINKNSYNGKELSKIITILQDNEKNSTLPILITVDGSIMLPVHETYKTKEIAVNKMNEIISALFLGGLNINAIHLGDLEQGTLQEGGEYSFSYMPSSYNRLRNNWASNSELNVLLNPNYIDVENIKNAYSIGIDLLNNISFSPIYLVQGYHSMQLWKTADALSNLWIVIEQLTTLIWNKRIEEKTKKLMQITNVRTENIDIKLKVLREYNIISEAIFQLLDKNRKNRNKLLHEGKLPDHNLVEKLWIILFKMFEIASNKKLDKLYEITIDKQSNNVKRFYDNTHKKLINKQNTNFDEWKSYC